MNIQDFKNVLLYMFNCWSFEEACRLFNNPDEPIQFSLGEYMWNKWVECRRDCGHFLLEIGTEELQKIIDAAYNYYNK